MQTFCLKDRTQIIYLQMSGDRNVSFFIGELHGLKYQMLSEDRMISYWYASVYPYQFQQSLSTMPDKGLLNGSS